MRPWNWADKKPHIPLAISPQNESTWESNQEYENTRFLFEHNTSNRLPKRWPPIRLQEATLFSRGEKIASTIPRLQPLVPTWRARCVEWDSLCRAFDKKTPKEPAPPTKKILGKHNDVIFWVHRFVHYSFFFWRKAFFFFGDIDINNNPGEDPRKGVVFSLYFFGGSINYEKKVIQMVLFKRGDCKF